MTTPNASAAQTAHTAGPWSCNVPPHKFPIYANHATDRFCYVAAIPHDSGVPIAERDANARLIAASPDLLRAVQMLLAQYGRDENDQEIVGRAGGYEHAALSLARAAIAKAEGRPNYGRTTVEAGAFAGVEGAK